MNTQILSWVLVGSAWFVSGCGSTPAPSTVVADAGADVETSDTANDTGTSDTTSTDTSTTLLSKDIAAFCDPWATWACGRAMACSCTTPKNGPLTEPVCLTAMQAACQSELAAVGGAIAEGLAAIETTQVSACLSWLDQQLPTCVLGGLAAMGPGPCRQWVVQLPGPAGQCGESNLRCADGSACTAGSCGGALQEAGGSCDGAGQCKSLACNTDSGTCVTPKILGQACNAGDQCPLFSTCKAGSCTAPGQAGQACTSTEDCAHPLACLAGKCAAAPSTCDATTDCGAGGGCLGDVFNICQGKLAAGAPCSQDNQCSAGTWCDPVSQTCSSLPDNGLPCASGVLCGPGLGCNPETSQCEPLPAAGKPCAMGEFGPMLCAAGLVCQTDTFVCATPPAQGAPCNAHANCSPSAGKEPGDLVCAFGPTGSSCVQRQPKGAKCENDVCQVGLYCDYKSNSCADLVATGGKCSAGNECGLAGSCVPDNVGQLRCVPLPTAGQACLLDCGDGLFCNLGMKNTTCQPQICQLFYQLN